VQYRNLISNISYQISIQAPVGHRPETTLFIVFLSSLSLLELYHHTHTCEVATSYISKRNRLTDVHCIWWIRLSRPKITLANKLSMHLLQYTWQFMRRVSSISVSSSLFFRKTDSCGRDLTLVWLWIVRMWHERDRPNDDHHDHDDDDETKSEFYHIALYERVKHLPNVSLTLNLEAWVVSQEDVWRIYKLDFSLRISCYAFVQNV